ncbi:beta-glucosidase [Bifidobacterium miconisargentati]|uniref:beta-glucosidase n=1 Tax=Bifidobacterium miconisargentati TaxID=2834437 RepID=UPI001BDD18B3|nr:glycoside hydrolase family 3 C-terminal domain-containing protein [Bifidobacterium miconisargentati]MBW3089480.1 glycoside hydrolase family 3 C-terminal domain-containing protein [Bifidobacterium miconisargentati]
MKQKKLRMRGGIFRAIVIPIMAVFVIFAVVLTVVTNYFTPSLDAFLGKGAKAYSNPNGTSGWDASYYDFDASNSEEALKNSAVIAERIADEGEVLLKNDGTLPLKSTTAITPMGYRYLNPVMSGSGSGSTNTSSNYVYDAEKGITEAFDNVNTEFVNAMKKAATIEVAPKSSSGEGGATAFLGSGLNITEYDVADLKSVASTCKDTVGIVFIGRVSGEGGDLYSLEYEDGTPHELALTQAERNMIDYAKTNCKHVVVVLNSTNTMQIPELQDDNQINAILQIATPGALGFKSLGRILNGEVNPSGRTVDTFVSDLTTSPTYANFDNGTGMSDYENTSYTRNIWLAQYLGGAEFKAPFREYEEGVYMGYRWYETASEVGYFTSSNLPAGEADPYYNRDNGVVYPFGYGLSYTTFKQEIANYDDSNDRITVDVSVTNTGDVAGKEVVQVYYRAPYTQFDIDNSIEKPTANLIAFSKTRELQPGASETVTLIFNKEDMASYCYTHTNGNNTTGSYVLEKGDYAITLRADSHDVIDERTTNVAKTIWYNGEDGSVRESEKIAQSQLNDDGTTTGMPAKAEENPDATYVAASNQFDHANQYMTDSSIGHDVTILTRADWNHTQPSAPTDETRQASDTVKKWLDYGYATSEKYGNGEWDEASDSTIGNGKSSKIYVAEKDAPASGKDNGLTMSNMRGLSYYDKRWDNLLDQIDYNDDQINYALFANGYASGGLDSVGKPATSEHDGPQGLALNDSSGNSWVDACSFPSATTMAQTFNVELAYAMGAAVGEENYFVDGGGWYAPAVNMHWSAFSGRNYEYYSEDPLVSGKMAAQVISGAGDKGTYCALKHFAMIEQEEWRSWIPSAWATEQTVREIYLKPFEIAVKEAKKTIKYISDDKGTVSTKTMRAADCMMTSGWSGIGGLWTAYDYNLMTNVLRNEWGFQGFVITDYDQGNGPNDNVAVNRMVRAGVDQHMIDKTLSPGKYTSTDTATGKAALRRAVKNTLYTMANSAQTNNLVPGGKMYYRTSPWRLGVYAVDVIITIGVAVGIIMTLRRAKDEKIHPENYKSKRNGK